MNLFTKLLDKINVTYFESLEVAVAKVDILISKNQALQMLCLKHHVYKFSWIRNLQTTWKFDPHKIKNIPYSTNCY